MASTSRLLLKELVMGNREGTTTKIDVTPSLSHAKLAIVAYNWKGWGSSVTVYLSFAVPEPLVQFTQTSILTT